MMPGDTQASQIVFISAKFAMSVIQILAESSLVLLVPAGTQGSRNVRKLGFRTTLSVPLLSEGVALGTINLRRVDADPFTDKQIALLQTFADQAVIAIENVRLFDEVQARTEELSESLRQQIATAEVLKTISRTAFDLQRVLETLLDKHLATHFGVALQHVDVAVEGRHLVLFANLQGRCPNLHGFVTVLREALQCVRWAWIFLPCRLRAADRGGDNDSGHRYQLSPMPRRRLSGGGPHMSWCRRLRNKQFIAGAVRPRSGSPRIFWPIVVPKCGTGISWPAASPSTASITSPRMGRWAIHSTILHKRKMTFTAVDGDGTTQDAKESPGSIVRRRIISGSTENRGNSCGFGG
jgi:GAF domain